MISKIAIALGAGFASALLFFIPLKGTTAAMILALLGPLPMMIAGLGYGAGVGFGAVAAGTVAIGLAIDPLLGLFFAASLGVPAFWLSHLAGRRRILVDPERGDTFSAPLYSSGQLLAWMATLAAASAMLAATQTGKRVRAGR